MTVGVDFTVSFLKFPSLQQLADFLLPSGQDVAGTMSACTMPCSPS